MKVISFNANGIRAAARKGFYAWLHGQQPDFVCIQETKSQIHQLESDALYFPEPFFCEYFDAEKRGYSGVALYARKKPNAVIKGLGFAECDSEGRSIQFDYDAFSIISLYMPSGSSSEERQQIKYIFLESFAEKLTELKAKGRELIVCGDYNIAHKAIDLKNWRGNQSNSGFLPEERAWMDVLFGSMGFIDAFRMKNQNADEYTWWSNRGRAWEKNVGWRIDYQVVTPGIAESVSSVSVYRENRFSDHAPLIIEYSSSCFTNGTTL